MYILNEHDIILSLIRWLLGLSIGSIFGLLLALITNIKFLNHKSFRLVIDFFRAIPLLGLIPVVQMNIGINEYGKIGIIIWSVTFVVWITVKNSMEKSIPSCELMLKGANLDKLTILKNYSIPKVINGFFKGIELSIGVAWLCVVAAEWVGTYTTGFWSGGLGYKLIVAYELNNWSTIKIILGLFGILGLSSSLLWRYIIHFTFSRNKHFNPTHSIINIEP